jgi:hypothetical protein
MLYYSDLPRKHGGMKILNWQKKNNERDFASINEPTVLSNLETHNAQMIREGRNKVERFQILKEIAEYQLNVLKAAGQIKLIEEK